MEQNLQKKKKDIDKVFKNNFSKALKSEKQNSIKENKSLASRKASELTLNALTKANNTLIGGSADLAGSNNTKTKHHNLLNLMILMVIIFTMVFENTQCLE